MAIDNFIPSIWSAKLFVRLRKALVFGNIVNTDYEGEISGFGSSVRINEIGPITVSDYTKYSAMTWQELESAQKILNIDQGKSFSFAIDDIDTAQSKPKVMNDAMGEASYAIADTVDQYIAGKYAEAGVTGSSTFIGSASSSIAVSSGNVIETISYVQRYLNESNVPTGDRFGIITPWLHQKLIIAETGGIASTGVPKVRDDGVIMNGFVGRAFGFDLMMSNNVSTDETQYRMMFGTRQAISYAGQVAKTRAVQREDYWDDGVKGLYVYGCKVVRPNALCTLYASEGTG